MTNSYSAAARRAAVFFALAGLWAGFAARCPAAIVEYPIPSPGAAPEGITCGPDGAYWFTEYASSRIGRISPTNGLVTEYSTPTYPSGPFGIVTGPDGNLWFTESAGNQVGRITTNGVIEEFAVPFGFIGTGIALGADKRLWVTDFGLTFGNGVPTNGGIIALTVTTNGITNAMYYNANLTVHSRPLSIASGPDGNLYFTEDLAGKIGRITTNGVITESALLPTNCQPFDITTGPDGALWFTLANSNALGRIAINSTNFSASTNLSLFTLPTNNTSGAVPDQLEGIVLGRDGNLYYADPPPNLIGRVQVSETTNATNLTVAQFYTPTTNSFPLRLATGPDRNIWFGEYVGENSAAGDNIGEFLLPVPLSIQLISNLVVISWTTNVGTNFTLEENPGFNPTNWVLVTNVPVVVTNTNNNSVDFTVDLAPTNGPTTNTLFFRLID